MRFLGKVALDQIPLGGTGMHGIKCTCLEDEPYPCIWHGYDNRNSEEILILDFDTGDHQTFVRSSNEEFRTSKWMEVKSMDGMCDPVDKRREECAVKEAQKERKLGADYMRQRHGLVESREPAYRPVGGKKKGKY